MVGSRLAAVAAVLSVLLAGCSSSGGSGDAPSGSSSSSTSAGPAPVVAVIAWHVKAQEEGGAAEAGTDATVVDAGTALAFDASGSTGAIATYAWDFGDGATSANKVAEHAYGATGAYNVTLTVSSLANATSTAKAAVQVGAGKGLPAFQQSEAVAGELPLMNPNSCTTQDVDCKDHAITLAGEDANGTPVQANRVRVAITGSSDLPSAAMQAFWRAPDGTALAQTEAGGLEHSLDYAGAMPPGEYILRVRLFTGALATYEGTVLVDYVTA